MRKILFRKTRGIISPWSLFLLMWLVRTVWHWLTKSYDKAKWKNKPCIQTANFSTWNSWNAVGKSQKFLEASKMIQNMRKIRFSNDARWFKSGKVCEIVPRFRTHILFKTTFREIADFRPSETFDQTHILEASLRGHLHKKFSFLAF